ncbi:MAG: head-tail adaptor protein [Amaricoccus sp.]
MSGSVNLSRRLALEERVSTPDGAGGFVVDWKELGMLWADVAARTGSEDFVGGQVRPRIKYRILVRGAPLGSASRPRPDQRFRDGTRIFNILTVAEFDPRGRYLEVYAEEGVLP